MATPIQRITAIVDALLDATATSAQLTTVGDGYVNYVSDEYVMDNYGKAKADLTNSERAHIAVTVMRQQVKTFLKASNAAKIRRDAEAQAEADVAAAGDDVAGGL